MADWPTVADVKQSLGVTITSRDGLISAALGAAIEQVAVDIGYEQIEVSQDSEPTGPFVLNAVLDPDDESVPSEIVPTHSLSQAALILATMAVKAPDAPYGIAAAFDLGAVRVAADHPTYLRLLKGQRHTFGLA